MSKMTIRITGAALAALALAGCGTAPLPATPPASPPPRPGRPGSCRADPGGGYRQCLVGSNRAR
jgi:hypothetical protein